MSSGQKPPPLVVAVVALALAAYAVYRRRRQAAAAAKIQIVEQSPTHPSFLLAKQAFAQNFADGLELGAQVACFVDGQPVLNLRGARDQHSFNDLTIVFSCTKVMESLAVSVLVDQGKLQYEDPICKHWPEFGARFSKETTVQQLMQHQAGLNEIHELIPTFEDARRVFEGSTAQELEQWLLRTLRQKDAGVTKYHAVTRGFFVDVLCARCDGRRIRDFIQQEIVQRVKDHDVEFYVGCHTEEIAGRTARCERGTSRLQATWDYLVCKLGLSPSTAILEYEADLMIEFAKGMLLGAERSRVTKTFFSLAFVGQELEDTANHAEMRRLPYSSVLGTTNAYSMARIGQELVASGASLFLSEQGMRQAMASDGPEMDQLFVLELDFTACGWGLGRLAEGWCGWDGAGGSVFVWSPKHRASFAYVPSMLDARVERVRAMRILRHVIDALEEEERRV